MIKRKIDRYLADFFETDKKALMLTGLIHLLSPLLPWHETQRLYKGINQ